MSKAAETANLPKTTLSSLLSRPNSLPRCDIALGVAKALRVPLDWLVDDSQDWPSPEPLSIESFSDMELMGEACRRLALDAARINKHLDNLEQLPWKSDADAILGVPANEPLTAQQETMSFYANLIADSGETFMKYDASSAIKAHKQPGPDLDDVRYRADALMKKIRPEIEAIRAYFNLRHLADYLSRHGASEIEKSIYDTEGQRQKIIDNLHHQRNSG